MLGVLREDVEDNSDFEVWPENWVAFQIMRILRTQWRVGSSGYTGLDYGVAFRVMDEMHVEDVMDTLDRIRVMEFAALDQIHKS